MYSAKKIQEETGSTSNSKMTSGFHTNVTLTGIDVEPGKYVDIHFKNKNGEVHNRRIWPPNPDMINPRDGESLEEAKQRDEQERLGIITDMLSIVVDDLDDFSAPTYDQYMLKAKQEIMSNVGDTTFNIKLIPTKDGKYSEFPRYGKWVTEYSENKPHGLKYSKWELENRVNVERPKSDDMLLGKDNPSETYEMF